MELSDSRIKKVLIFSQKKFFLSFRKWNLALFKPKLQKQKKIHPEKNSLYFGKWSFLALIFKNFLYFGKWKSRKKFLIFQETETLKSFLYFGKRNFFYILENGNPEKVPYISGETFKAPKTKISYISPKNVLNKFF